MGGVARDEELLEDSPEEVIAKKIVKATPWWAVSLAFHALVLSCLPLIVFSYKFVEADEMFVGIVLPPKNTKVDLGDRPRSVIEKPEMPPSENKLTDEQRIFFPGAEESTRNESANNEDTQKMKGESETEALSWLVGKDSGIMGRRPGTRNGLRDSMGVGGGSGGSKRFGTRFGGKRDLVARGGGSAATESAVDAGLRWLARHQRDDGSWWNVSNNQRIGFQIRRRMRDGKPLPKREQEEDVADVVSGCTCGAWNGSFGLNGLAVLAFLGAGYSPESRARYIDPIDGQTRCYGEIVQRGLKFLVDNQGSDGGIGTGTHLEHHMVPTIYDQSLATWALCEAFGMTNGKAYKTPAQKAVEYLVYAQNKGAAWRYRPRGGDNDTSVSGFAIMALKSAQSSGFDVPEQSFKDALSYLNSVTDQDGGGAYYKGTGPTPPMTAVAMVCRMFIERDQEDPLLAGAAETILENAPQAPDSPTEAASAANNFYFLYAATLALYQYDGPDGDMWRQWNDKIVKLLCNGQHRRSDKCLDGSWSCDMWVGTSRVMTTAMGVLMLEVYYRYESLFGSNPATHKRKNAATPLTPEEWLDKVVEVNWNGRWLPAKVLKVQDGRALIRYDQMGANWDEWVTSKRIRHPEGGAPKPPRPVRDPPVEKPAEKPKPPNESKEIPQEWLGKAVLVQQNGNWVRAKIFDIKGKFAHVRYDQSAEEEWIASRLLRLVD
ncbi:hypothetical protein HY251_13260 [bacterium]|nr:hypothetical protein [bacterium]